MRRMEFEEPDAAADQAVVPDRVRRAGKATLWLGFALPVAIYAAIVLLAPTDVLDRLPGAKRFADGVHDWVLARWSVFDIYRHARSTVFPQVAMLASALGACLTAAIALILIVHSNLTFRYVRATHALRPVSAQKRFAGLVVLPIAGLFFFWACYCLKGDPSFAAGLTTRGRLGYAFMSSATILFAGAGCGIWPTQVRLFLFDVFSREKS